MFGRATIRLGIGPHSRIKNISCHCYVYIIRQKASSRTVANICDNGDLQLTNVTENKQVNIHRNLELPRFGKTGLDCIPNDRLWPRCIQ